jgi:hypothetical protein
MPPQVYLNAITQRVGWYSRAEDRGLRLFAVLRSQLCSNERVGLLE